ncbi:hypothetical protein MMC11_008240 [Xylographa trunciseda]|nr:hypothetical protein [Xylographa trunciseda]
MSFGFSIGDFIALGRIARELYRDIYLVARGAPEELQSLMTEIGALSQSIDFLVDEIKDPESILVSAGESRRQTVNDMMRAIKLTLDDMEKLAAKHRLINKSAQRSKLKRGWDKVKWASDLPSVNSLRSRILYQNGILSLLLTLAKNSSLERIQAQTQKMNHNIEDIQNLLANSPTAPVISIIDGEVSQKSLSWALLKQAEKVRPWLAPGIDEWIQAGKCITIEFLKQAQSRLYIDAPTNRTVPVQAYTDLLKASWILVDVISQHPQQRFLSSTSGSLEAQVFAETVKAELTKIEALGLIVPNHEQISKADLTIWAEPPPTFSVNPREVVVPEEKQQSWRTPNTQVYFQAFGHFRSKRVTTAIECFILVLVYQLGKNASIVAQVQKGVEVFGHNINMRPAVNRFGEIDPDDLSTIFDICSGTPDADGNWAFRFDDEYLLLNSYNDRQHFEISMIVLHFLRYSTAAMDLDVFQGLVLLAAISGEDRCLVQQLLNDMTQSGKDNDTQELSSESEFENIRELANGVARLWLRENKSHSLWNSDLLNRLVKWLNIKSDRTYISRNTVWFYSLLQAPAALLRSSWILILVKAGINLRVPGFGIRPLSHAICVAALVDDVKMLAALLRAAEVLDISSPAMVPGSFEVSTPLQAAAREGSLRAAKMLIDHGADVNSGREPPVVISAKNGHLEVLIALLQSGADANKTALYESPILNYAIKWGHTMVQVLLEHGANVDAQENCNHRAIHRASIKGDPIILKMLLDHGANVNAKTRSNLTPLLLAVDAGHEPIVRLLLDHGADTGVPFREMPASKYKSDCRRRDGDLEILMDDEAEDAEGNPVLEVLEVEEGPSARELAEMKVKGAHQPAKKRNAEKILQILIDHRHSATKTLLNHTQSGEVSCLEGPKQSKAPERPKKRMAITN